MYDLLRISSICSGKKFSRHYRSRLVNVGDLPLVDIPIFKFPFVKMPNACLKQSEKRT